MKGLNPIEGITELTRQIQKRSILQKSINEILTDLTNSDKMIAFNKAGGIEAMREIFGIQYAFEVELQMMQNSEYKAFATRKALLRLATVPIRLPIHLVRRHTKKTLMAILMATQLDGCQNALHLPTQVDCIDFFNKQGDLDVKVGPAAWDRESD